MTELERKKTKMNYETVEQYLNEEFRKPIKHYLKNTPKKTQKKVMQVVDHLCDKYRETGGTAMFYEEKLKASTDHSASESLDNFMEWRIFMDKKGYLKPIDYDALDDAISEDEMKVMMGEEKEIEES